MAKHVDVTPPGREAQVRALKEKPGIDNPYAVAWASYEGDDGMDMYDGATCPACSKVVPVVSDKIDKHMVHDIAGRMPGSDHADASETPDICPGSGASRMDHIEKRGGKYVLLSKSTGKVLGTHATRAGAVAQEQAIQAAKHSDSTVRRFERIDFSASELPRKQVTADGFWRVAGKVARTGIQEYRDSAGGIRRELRLPEDVAASLPSFALQPLTNNHPPVMVTPDNAKRFVAGAVGEATMDGGWVTAPLTIYDASAIAAVEGGRAQLSVGYSCRLDDQAGEWNGQKYDAVQRDIVVNHVAIVDIARAGSEARIRLDAGDAITGDPILGLDSAVLTSFQEPIEMPIKMKLDGGHEIELANANDQAAIERHVESATKASDKLAKKAQEKADAAEQSKADADKKASDAQKALDTLQGKFDTLTAKVQTDAAEMVKVEGAEISMGDFRDPAKRDPFLASAIDKRANARTVLVIEAQKHLGTKEKLDGKSDLEVKKMVVAKLNKSAKLDDKNADYVQACYDMAIADAKPVAAIDAARAGAGPTLVQTDATAPSDGKSAYEAMRLRMLAANPKNQVR